MTNIGGISIAEKAYIFEKLFPLLSISFRHPATEMGQRPV
jgi:hypothetical protein